MDYVIIISIIIAAIYGTLLIHKSSRLNFVVVDIVLVLTNIGIFFLLQLYFSFSLSLISILIVDILVFFFLLQIETRLTIAFDILFVVTIGLVWFISYQNQDLIIYFSYIVLGLFLIGENNQIFMRKSYEEAATEYQNKILDKQVEEVQNIYVTMRSWRHDYHNHLQKLKAHITMNQITEAHDYLNDLEVDLDNVNQLVDSGNINVDAILNSKLSLAIKNNIDITFKARVPKQLQVSDIDLCVLLGNLIDNAVEANEKIKNHDSKFIRLYIGIFKKQLYISVTNSTSEVIRKLSEEYITTKRGNHGHGLKRINNIVDKYEGYINRQNEPGVFATEVLLPL